MSVDLSDADSKLARAREHIDDVDKRISNYLSSQFYRLRFTGNPNTGFFSVIFDSLHNPDKTVNAAIGDAIGNLRSTLDYMTVAIVEPITGDAGRVEFPLADDANGFKGEVEKRHLKDCDPRVHSFFLDQVQAYKGGKGNSIWALNKLRNIDKHRFLLAAPHLAGVMASWRAPNGATFLDAKMKIMAGKSGPFLHAPPGTQFIRDPSPLFEVRIDEPPYVSDVPALDFLKSAATDVETVLNAVRAGF
jgi:hypothetical protein